MAFGERQSVSGRIAGWLETKLDAERDQLPLWLPVGLGVGIAFWFQAPQREHWIAFILSGGAIAAICLGFGFRARASRCAAVFALAAALGCALIWAKAETRGDRLERPVAGSFMAEIESVERLPAREIVRVRLRRASDPRLPERFRVNIPEELAPSGLAAGTWIQLNARLMPPPEAGIPGAYDFARRAWFDEIGATGRAWGEVQIVRRSEAGGLSAALGRQRTNLADHIRERVADGPGAIAATLATGDRSAIGDADAEAMRRSGLAHLLAISGLHVTAVIGVVMLLVLKMLALSERIALRVSSILVAAAVGALAGIGYTLFTGAQVPTIRACIAALFVLAGIAIGRDAITLRLVAAGALIVLLFWPETLVGPSFQLSFTAVIAIVALHEHPRIKRLLSRRDEPVAGKIGRFALGLFLTGLAVEIALMPIALYHFNKAGIYGALANMIAIPLTTFIVIPLESLALLLDAIGLGAPVWWLVGEALGLLLTLAHRVSETPGSVALLPAMPVGAFAAIVAGGLWFFIWRTSWRRWGWLPIAGGALWAVLAVPPDIYVTGDGRHLALRGADDRLALLRPGAGDYVRDILNETAGIEREAVALDRDGSANCNSDVCRISLWRGGRQWRIFATRSSYYLPIGAMRAECAAADIVISDRRLPPSCTPRWLKIDRDMLRQTGGLAITLTSPSVQSVRTPGEDHPWRSRAERLSPARQ